MVYKLYKLANFFYKIKLTPFAVITRAIMRVLFSCDIPYKTEIGKNVKFPHLALGVTMHPDVKIGDECVILQNVTIGGKSGHKEVPVIGKNVLIGANAVIIGPIKIGDNAIIGAGSVVLHDVDENEVVAGVPAKKIKMK